MKYKMEKMHQSLYENSKRKFENSVMELFTWKDFMKCIRNKKIAKVSFCGKKSCEQIIVKKSGEENKASKKNDNDMGGSAKSLCILEDKDMNIGENSNNQDIKMKECFMCREKAVGIMTWEDLLRVYVFLKIRI